jgi:biopolymer transport protein ExbB/TolQ
MVVGVVKWIVLGAVALGVIILIASFIPVLRRVSGLKRAMDRVQRRRAEAMKLQDSAAGLEQTMAGLQERLETMQDRLTVIQAARGK